MERRIAAIVAADMVGYSRLVELDEEGTIARQKRHMVELIEPAFERNNGRIIKTTGDGLIAEFPSVVDAVQCSVHVQKEMLAREEDVADDLRIRYRIGINLGDVIFDDGDVYGDGVNIAARLEGLADPGGIVISGTAYDLLKANVEVGYEALGERQVKNIATPVRVYKVVPEGAAGENLTPTPSRPPRRWGRIAAVAAVLLALVAGSAAWWLTRPDFEPVDPKDMAFKLPEKPSIAVLPFENLSGDDSQQWLADGFNETVISLLATAPELFVAAGGTMATYKGKPVQFRDVARELGVRYLLKGGVQRQGQNIRVTAQLVDATKGGVLWSNIYDRSSAGLFAIQDDIARDIVAAIDGKIRFGIGVEALRRWAKNPKAYARLVKAQALSRGYSLEAFQQAQKETAAVLKQDPENPFANVLMGWMVWSRVEFRVSTDPAKDLAEAARYGERALAGEGSSHPHFLLGVVRTYQKKYPAARRHAERILEISDGDGETLAGAGYVYIATGEPERGIELIKRGMRLYPYYPEWMPLVMGSGLLMLGRHDDVRALTKELLSKKTRDARAHAVSHAYLAAIEIFENNHAKAQDHIKRLLTLKPDATTAFFLTAPGIFPYQNTDFLDRYVTALRKAGLPDFTPAQREKMKFKLPEKKSIVVLPFRNQTGDKERKYIPDALTEAIIDALATEPEITLMSRKTSFGLDPKTGPAKAAEKLGVQFVLEGSVSGPKHAMKIRVRLSDALSGKIVWSQSWDGRKSGDVFELLEKIAGQVLIDMQVKHTLGEKAREWRRTVRTPEQYQMFVKGRVAFQRFNPDDHAEAGKHWGRLLKEAPDLAVSHYLMGWYHWQHIGLGLSNDIPADFRKARAFVERALAIEDRGEFYNLVATLDLMAGKFDDAIRSAKKAIERAPGNSDVAQVTGYVLGRAGLLKEGIAQLELGMRLEPDYPTYVPMELAFFKMQLGDLDGARAIAEALLRDHASDKRATAFGNAYLAAIAVWQGDLPKARGHVAGMLKIFPHSSRETVLTARRTHRDRAFVEKYTSALVKAGLPSLAPLPKTELNVE